ncbi:MAG TPA: glycosyltransferase family 87 protein, partial [Isosphaeraceae bacterium]|nr:glycosyltransferase family 87 protein [Isosphaeraceae bacterium]
GKHALSDSADLGRRIEEMALFRSGADPYADPDATYPPSAWFLFEVLIPDWSEPAVRGLWLILNLGVLAGLTEGVRRWVSQGQSRFWIAAVLLALMATKPVRAGLALGQFHLIPTALAVWAVVLIRDGKSRWAGICLGVALVKPTMVLPILAIWAVQGQFSALVTAGGVQAGLWLGASAWLRKSPVALLSEWLRNAHAQEAAGTIDLPTLLNHWGFERLIPANMATLLVLVICLGWFYRLRKVEETGLASLALVVSAVFAYHRHYDLVLLLPPLAWLASREVPSWRTRFAMVLMLFLVAPVHVGPLRDLAAAYDLVFLVLCYGFLVALALEVNLKPVSSSAGFPRLPRTDRKVAAHAAGSPGPC